MMFNRHYGEIFCTISTRVSKTLGKKWKKKSSFHVSLKKTNKDE